MITAKLFKSGNSQALRLPKEYRFEGKEIGIKKVGDIVLLVPKTNSWATFAKSLDMFTDDYMDGKRQHDKIDTRVSL